MFESVVRTDFSASLNFGEAIQERDDLQGHCGYLTNEASSVEMPHHLFTFANQVRTKC